MLILGAGLAGLLAGTQFQTATILEAGPEGHVAHKALLRFRTSAVGDSLGIPFRRVCVRKGIWFDGEFVPPSIEMANCYSRKVIGRFLDRSIWNIDSVERYIAPENLIEQLIERCGKRILWRTPLSMGSEETKEKAETIADEMKAFHLERCPNDRVEMIVREVLL